MSKKVTNKKDEFENVEHALSASEAFVEKYQKQILYGLGAVAVVVIAFLAINNFYVKPRAVEAANEMYRSQLYFATDSFRIALQGDGFESIGFEEISNRFSSTPSGSLAKAYAGICYFKLGDYEEAIRYLSRYDGKDKYFSIAVVGMIGDAYAELGDVKKAIRSFSKAAEAGNEVMTPFFLKKAALLMTTEGENDKALKNFLIIKEKFPLSAEAQEVDKYISLLQ